MKLYPAILTDSAETFKQQLDLVRMYPQLPSIHVDVVDGFFADNMTLTPLDLLDFNFDGLELYLHLMVNEPLDFVFEAISIRERLPIVGIVAQIERMTYQSEYIQEVKRHGWKIGMALDLHTPLEAIDENSWDQLDMLQLMSIEAGFQGHAFSSQVLPKVTEAQQHLKSLNHELELILDGGIKVENVETALQSGVNSVVVGSGIWASPDQDQALTSFIQKLSL